MKKKDCMDSFLSSTWIFVYTFEHFTKSHVYLLFVCVCVGINILNNDGCTCGYKQ